MQKHRVRKWSIEKRESGCSRGQNAVGDMNRRGVKILLLFFFF